MTTTKKPRRRVRKPSATSSAASAPQVTSEKRPRTDKSKRGGKNNQRRPNRFLDEYLKQTDTGIASISKAPRDVALHFSDADAQLILKALRTQKVPAPLVSYVESKIDWTASYNRSL